MASHLNQRLRHDVVFRTLDVLRVERLTPHMQRVTFGGPQLRGFCSPSPDDHVKLFLPNRAGQLVPPALGPGGIEFPAGLEPSPMRDYTPRRHDAERGELVIDFVLHGDGPASTWAWQAGPGQQLGIGGPRGSFMLADDFDRYVLIGDETALPAIGRWLEEMPATARITALVEVPEARDRQPLPTRSGIDITWLERDGRPADREGMLEHALHELPAHPGDTFYWIATESHRARAMRQWLDLRGIPKDWIKATGYWKAGPDDD